MSFRFFQQVPAKTLEEKREERRKRKEEIDEKRRAAKKNLPLLFS